MLYKSFAAFKDKVTLLNYLKIIMQQLTFSCRIPQYSEQQK